jgi:hypothetical protein
VLFVGEYGWLQSFTKHFLAQPARLSDLDAMRETLHFLAGSLPKSRQALVLYDRAVASSPTLRGGVLDRQQRDIATIAGAIAARRELLEPDLACTTLATVVLITYRNALKRWVAGPASADPRKFIREGFDVVLAELAAATPAPRTRASLRAVSR